MKNIYLIGPDNFGIFSMGLPILRKRENIQLDFTDTLPPKGEKFRYKNPVHRLHNFFLKNFRNKNLKHIYYQNWLRSKIAANKNEYDAIIVIRPDLISYETLQLLRKKTNHFIAYYWDSVDFFPQKKETASFFHKVYSFDKADCEKYGYTFLANFFISEKQDTTVTTDAYSVFSFDNRKTQLEKIAMAIESMGARSCIKALSQRPIESPYFTRLHKGLDYATMIEEMAHCKVVIEVQKEGQQGLTFRPFEAMGMEKKLITNNPQIKEYDFYRPENICVVEADNVVIPEDFFTAPYKKINPAIKQKYHLNCWFDTLISPI